MTLGLVCVILNKGYSAVVLPAPVLKNSRTE
jgi:hypothetical protein